MSIHKRNDGWQVKWRDSAGHQRARMFDRKGDADTFDREIKRRKQLGPALMRELERGTLTLDEFVRTGFRAHSATLSRKTRDGYAWALGHHLQELVDQSLVAIDVPMLAAHQQFLLDNGRTVNTVREAIAALSGVLQIAVEHGHIPANPARALRKIPAPPREEVRPLAPAELEALIADFTGRDRAITVLGGHLGLRPMEIRLAPWSGFDGTTLIVGRARTKRSAARTRVIAVAKATAHELKAWRLESGGRDEDPIIGPWSKDSLARWGWATLQPAAKALTGRDDVTLYTLRHTHASACHYADFTVPAAARRLGHGGGLHLQTYAHVIDALEGKPRHADLDALITAARAELATPAWKRRSS